MSDHNTPVRELEWVQTSPESWHADTGKGAYRILEVETEWFTASAPRQAELLGSYVTLKGTQEACQADFQKRVNECLAEPKSTGWRDIESDPPKEEQECLFLQGSFHFQGFWLAAAKHIVACGAPYGESVMVATHWQPLPPPPGEEGAGLPDAGGGKQSQLLDALLLIESALKGHHQAAQDIGTVIFPDAPGVEVDMSDGYADSALADKTTKALQAFDELGKAVMAAGYEEALRAENAELKAELVQKCATMRVVERICTESASLMRNPDRTGGWAGAERVAQSFDRCADRLRSALSPKEGE